MKPTPHFNGPPPTKRTTNPPRVCRRCHTPTVTAGAWPEFGPVCPACPLPIRVPGLTGAKARCKAAALAAVGAAPEPLVAKQLHRAMAAAGHGFSISTLRKALGDLTAGGRLVNARAGTGYRLPGKAVRP